MIKLICKRVIYHSIIDEDMFFEWLDRIPAIKKIDGEGDELYLHFSSKRIPYKDLLELTSLFCRYNVQDMYQLQIFVNNLNSKMYLGNPESYWYAKVFGKNT